MTKPTKYALPEQTLQVHNLGIEQIKAQINFVIAKPTQYALPEQTLQEHYLGIQQINRLRISKWNDIFFQREIMIIMK